MGAHPQLLLEQIEVRKAKRGSDSSQRPTKPPNPSSPNPRRKESFAWQKFRFATLQKLASDFGKGRGNLFPITKKKGTLKSQAKKGNIFLGRGEAP